MGQLYEYSFNRNWSKISGNVPGRGDLNSQSRKISNSKDTKCMCFFCTQNIDCSTSKVEEEPVAYGGIHHI